MRYGLPNFCIKSLILWQNITFYYINRVYRISNTPGTKFVKYGLRCSILHFKLNKTIKFERIFFSLEPFLESLQDVHVNKRLSLLDSGIMCDSNRSGILVNTSTLRTTEVLGTQCFYERINSISCKKLTKFHLIFVFKVVNCYC